MNCCRIHFICLLFLLAFGGAHAQLQYTVGVPVTDSILHAPGSIYTTDTSCYKYEIEVDGAFHNFLTGVAMKFVISDVSVPNCLYRIGYGFVNNNDTIPVSAGGDTHLLSAACAVSFKYQVLIHGTPQVVGEAHYCDVGAAGYATVDGCQTVVGSVFYPLSATKDCHVNIANGVQQLSNSDIEVLLLNDQIKVTGDSPMNCSLYDLQGQQLVTAIGQQQLFITTTPYPTGVYLLRVEHDNGIFSKKVLLHH